VRIDPSVAAADLPIVSVIVDTSRHEHFIDELGAPRARSTERR
jgi:hypothetical protein